MTQRLLWGLIETSALKTGPSVHDPISAINSKHRVRQKRTCFALCAYAVNRGWKRKWEEARYWIT